MHYRKDRLAQSEDDGRRSNQKVGLSTGLRLGTPI
jgi:hypothetical protein